MSSYQRQREARSRTIFTVLIIAVSVGTTYGLIRITLPSLTGQTPVNRSGFDGGSFYLIPISTLGVLVAV